MEPSRPSPPRTGLRPALGLLLLSLLSPALPAAEAGERPLGGARAVLAKIAEAYTAEDREEILSLMDPEGGGYEEFSLNLQRLFQKGNFFEVRYDDLELVETRDGAVAGSALYTIRYRKLGRDGPEIRRAAVDLRFERDPEGGWRLVQHHYLPDPTLPPDSPARPVHYRLAVWLDPDRGSLRVEGDAEVRNVSVGEMEAVSFLLNGFAEDLEVTGPEGKPLDLRVQKGGTHIVEAILPGPVSPGGTASLSFRYLLDHPHSAGNVTIRGEPVSILGGAPWIPTFALPAEVQEPLFDFDMTVHVPPGWAAVSSGNLVAEPEEGKSRAFRWVSASPTGEIPLVAGRFRRTSLEEVAPEADAGPVEIRYWRPEGLKTDPAEATLLNRIAEAYRVLSESLGAPPEPWVNVVATDRYRLYGGTRLWVVDRDWLEKIFRYSPGTALRFGHQAAHSWFVHGVAPAGPGTAFLREGPSEIMACHLVRSLFGDEGGDRMVRMHLETYLNTYRSRQPLGLVQTLTPRDLYTGRVKGCLVLNDLRRLTGDEAFLGGLARYLGRHRGRTASVWDLQAALEEEAQGAEGLPAGAVAGFFGDFLFGSALPDPAVESVTSTREGEVWKTVVTVANRGDGRVRVPVEAQTASALAQGVVFVDGGASRELVLETGEQVVKVVLDRSGTLYQAERENDYWPSPPGRLHPSRKEFGPIEIGREKLEEAFERWKETE